VRDLFRPVETMAAPDRKESVLLIWAVAFPLFFRSLPGVRKAGARTLLASAALGPVIGVTEEVLWRGVYARVFPDSVALGYVDPSVASGFWHIAPQSVATNRAPSGALCFGGYSVLLGLSYGA